MANLQICLDEIQIYVGTYKKYNEGSIYGKWLQLSDYSDFDELLEAMKELHKDEEEPEFMLQDFEVPELFERMELITEYHISKNIYEAIEAIMESNYDISVLDAYVDCFGYYCNDIYELIEKIEESYQGEYNNDEEFTEELLVETCSIPSDLPHYVHIDWESTAREIMMDYSASNGHYFRCF